MTSFTILHVIEASLGITPEPSVGVTSGDVS